MRGKEWWGVAQCGKEQQEQQEEQGGCELHRVAGMTWSRRMWLSSKEGMVACRVSQEWMVVARNGRDLKGFVGSGREWRKVARSDWE